MKKILLIVDDNEDIVNIVREYLADKFDEVMTASSVDQAQDLVEEHKFSLITLDINLQGRNGSEVLKYISISSNQNQETPVVLISGMMTPAFIDKNKSRFAGILTKPFDGNVLQEIANKALKGSLPEHAPVQINDFADIPMLKCKMPFTVQELEENVAKVLIQIKKDHKLKKLFTNLKIDRDPNSYLGIHIGMLINISTAISMALEWHTDKTLTKFVYAAYLHDMALGNRNDLAKINSPEEVAKARETLPEGDFKLIMEHCNIAATTLQDIQEIPPDVVVMVRQHHELPRETGFPAKLSHKKIIPLSAVFIIAHDLTDYILENPEWTMKDYMKQARLKFIGTHFTKTLAALHPLT